MPGEWLRPDDSEFCITLVKSILRFNIPFLSGKTVLLSAAVLSCKLTATVSLR